MYVEPIGIQVDGPRLMLLDLWVHLEDLPTDQQTHVRALRKRGDSTLQPADFAWIRLRWGEWNSKRKETQMAKKKKTDEENGDTATIDHEDGDQMLLLTDLEPEHARPLKAAARKYKDFQKARTEALTNEIKQKDIIKGILHKLAEDKIVAPNADGIIQFRYNGLTIKSTPRDELVQVKFDEDSDE